MKKVSSSTMDEGKDWPDWYSQSEYRKHMDKGFLGTRKSAVGTQLRTRLSLGGQLQ